MITDPLFYLVAIPAVVLVGMAKGGFGGGMSLLGVPVMALVLPPLQAAGILLPILVIMDMVAIASYRGVYDRRSLSILLPAGLAGIAIGWVTATYVTDAHVRLILGVVALMFTLDYWLRSARTERLATHSVRKGAFWGAIAGFTSFVSHAGAPPFQVYMLPLRLAPRLLAGTAVIFFTTMNAVKLVPYFFLGQFSTENVWTSLVLLPLAPAATLLGVWLVKVVRAETFYRFTYGCMFLVALKLIWDGAVATLG